MPLDICLKRKKVGSTQHLNKVQCRESESPKYKPRPPFFFFWGGGTVPKYCIWKGNIKQPNPKVSLLIITPDSQ